MDPSRPPRRPDSERRPEPHQPLEPGRRVIDSRNQLEGVVLEFACQYAHPKAEPVYSYLIRWADGRVNALSEAAFSGDNGFELAD